MGEKYICPKCKSKNWQVFAGYDLPNNTKKCKDCGYEGTFLIVRNKK